MASKKNPSIFSTLQKTTANASAVNGEFTHQIPLDALEDNPLNRFSMAERCEDGETKKEAVCVGEDGHDADEKVHWERISPVEFIPLLLHRQSELLHLFFLSEPQQVQLSVRVQCALQAQ